MTTWATGSLTRALIDSLKPPAITWIVASPELSAVTTPVDETEATAGLLLLNRNDSGRSCALKLVLQSTACRAWSWK